MKKTLLFLSSCAMAFSIQAQTLIEQYPLDYGFVKGLNGTIGSSGMTTTDKENKAEGAMKFIGSNSITLGRPIINPTNGFTIMFWAKPEPSTGNRSWIGNREVCNTGSFFDLRANGNTKALSLEIYQSNGTLAGVGGMTYVENVWQHFAFVLDPVNKKTYSFLDGVLKNTATWTAPQSVTAFTDNADLYWSKSPCIGGNGATYGFIGSVDDIRIYSGVANANFISTIAQAQVAAPVKNFNYTDTEVYNNNMNNACLDNSEVFNQGISAANDRNNNVSSAIQFSGTSSVLGTNNKKVDPLSKTILAGTSSAISAWIKIDGNEPNGFLVASYADNSCSAGVGRFIFRLLNNKLSCYLMFDAAGSPYTIIDGSTTLAANTWYHVVMNFKQPFYSKDDVEYYIDGVKEITVANPISISSNFPSGAFIPAGHAYSATSIGGAIKGNPASVCNANAYAFNGVMDDVRIFGNILSANEVSTLYNAAPSSNNQQGNITNKLSFLEKFDFTNQSLLSSKYNAKLDSVTLTADRKGRANSALLIKGKNAFLSTGINMDSVFADGDGFSYSVWIRPDLAMANNLIVGHSGDGACEDKRQHYFRVLSGKVNFTASFTNNNGANFRNWNGSTTLAIGTWTHVVVNVKQPITGNNDVTIYVNGVKETTSATFGGNVTTGNLPTNGSIMGIGNYLRSTTQTPCNTVDDPSFKGAIDDIRIYDRTLCDDDISNLYNEDPTITSTEIGFTSESIALMVPNPSADGLFQVMNEGVVLSVSGIDGSAKEFTQVKENLKIRANAGLYLARIKVGDQIKVQRIQILN